MKKKDKIDRIMKRLKEKRINLSAPVVVRFNLKKGGTLRYNARKFDWYVRLSDVKKILKKEG